MYFWLVLFVMWTETLPFFFLILSFLLNRFYSLFSDLIMVQGGSHVSLCELQKGATVPVVSLGSHKFTPLQGFALLVTIQEHFGYLNGLSLGWVGPMGGMLNTLLYLLPKVGVHLKYNTEPIPVTLYFSVYTCF